MKSNRKKSLLDSLEQCRLVVTNVESHPEIQQTMNDIGYTAETMGEGKQLYETSLSAHENSKRLRKLLKAAYKAFILKWEILREVFAVDRSKSKVIFRKDSSESERLGLMSNLPVRYLKLIDVIKNFYTEIAGDEDLKSRVTRLNIPEERINEALSLIADVEALRAEYVKLKGDVQKTTELKRAVFREADEWLADFFAVARIAFKDDPQQLESFGKVVKSS